MKNRLRPYVLMVWCMFLTLAWGSAAQAVTLSGNLSFTPVTGGGSVFVAVFDADDPGADTLLGSTVLPPPFSSPDTSYTVMLEEGNVPDQILVVAFYDRNNSCNPTDSITDWPDYGDVMGYVPPFAPGTSDISNVNFSLITTYESGPGTAIYDDFTDPSGLFRTDKWREHWNALEFVRHVEDGALVSGLRSSTNRERNTMQMSHSGAVTHMKADVFIQTLNSGSHPDNRVFARVGASLYNSKSAAPDSEWGDVWAGLEIGQQAGEMVARISVEKSTAVSSEGSTWETIYWETIPVSEDLLLNTWYTLEIISPRDGSITFNILNGTTVIGSATRTGLPGFMGNCQDSYPGLTTGMNRNTNKIELCSIFAKFDNVEVNGTAYDPFDTGNLNPLRWRSTQTIRQIKDSRAVLMAESKGTRETNQLLFSRKVPHVYADVVIDPSSFALNSRIRFRLDANFYNDTYSGMPGLEYNGEEGNAWAQVYIDLDPDGSMAAKCYMARAERVDGQIQYPDVFYQEFTDFSGDHAIRKGVPYRLGIQFTGTRMIFSCSELDVSGNPVLTQTREHEIQTPAYPLEWEWAEISTRAYEFSGGDGTTVHSRILAHVSQVLIGTPVDQDGDALSDFDELSRLHDPQGGDMDGDGIMDGNEDINANGRVDWFETDPTDPDTDHDGVSDGTETGLSLPQLPAFADRFVEDEDPFTTTDPRIWDTDADGLSDGQEDLNANGRKDEGESDPNKSVTVSGRATDASGNPIAGLWVHSFDQACGGAWLGGDRTDADGRYTLRLASQVASVYVEACAKCDNLFYKNEWWDGLGGAGVSDCAQARDLGLAWDEDRTGIDFVLDPAGAVSGTITNGTNPISNIHVYAVVETACGGQWVAGTHTDETGHYFLSGLPEGDVYLHTCAGCVPQGTPPLNYIDEWYDDAFDCNGAVPVSVDLGQVTPGIDFVLEPGETVSGRLVEQGTNIGIPDVHVYVRSEKCAGVQYSQANTDDQGYFVIPGIPAGEVYLYICPECNGNNFVGEWYNGANGTRDCNGAVPVSIAIGSPVDLGTMEIEPGKEIFGQVTGVSPGTVHIWVSDWDKNERLGGQDAEPDGSFTVSGLPAPPSGKYRVCLDSGDTYYVGECYDTPLLPGATGISFTPVKGGRIQGHVTGSDTGGPLHLPVNAEQFNCGNHVTGNWTGNQGISGFYSFVVPPGEYAVQARPDHNSALNYIAGYWTGEGLGTVPDCASAGKVIVAAEQNLTVDFVLDPAGAVSGTITDGTDPIPDLHVYAVVGNACAGQGIAGTRTDENGHYLLSGLPEGDVYIRTCAECVPPEVPPLNYVDEWYDDALACDDAVPVLITLGQEIPDIDFSLEPGQEITGKVHGDTGDDPEPLEETSISVHDGNTGEYMGGTGLSAEGNFTVFGLPEPDPNYDTPGYRIYFNPGDTYFVWEEYPDLVSPGDFIELFPQVGGRIQGVVYGEDDQPLAGIDVTAFEPNCGPHIQGYRTDTNGRFSFTVPAGTGQDYVLLAHPSDPDSPYQYQYWTGTGGTRDCMMAEPVEVFFKTTVTYDFTLNPQVFAPGDFDEDADVDGQDLAEYIRQEAAGGSAVTLEDLSGSFGSVLE